MEIKKPSIDEMRRALKQSEHLARNALRHRDQRDINRQLCEVLTLQSQILAAFIDHVETLETGKKD